MSQFDSFFRFWRDRNLPSISLNRCFATSLLNSTLQQIDSPINLVMLNGCATVTDQKDPRTVHVGSNLARTDSLANCRRPNNAGTAEDVTRFCAAFLEGRVAAGQPAFNANLPKLIKPLAACRCNTILINFLNVGMFPAVRLSKFENLRNGQIRKCRNLKLKPELTSNSRNNGRRFIDVLRVNKDGDLRHRAVVDCNLEFCGIIPDPGEQANRRTPSSFGVTSNFQPK